MGAGARSILEIPKQDNYKPFKQKLQKLKFLGVKNKGQEAKKPKSNFK